MSHAALDPSSSGSDLSSLASPALAAPSVAQGATSAPSLSGASAPRPSIVVFAKAVDGVDAPSVSHAPTTPWERSFADLVGVAGTVFLAYAKLISGSMALASILLLLLPASLLRMLARALGARLSAAGAPESSATPSAARDVSAWEPTTQERREGHASHGHAGMRP